MNKLLKKKCVPCEKKGIKPFTKSEAKDYLEQVSDWKLAEDSLPQNKKAFKISKEFKFKDFIGAINFVDKVAEVAEMEGHHPDIHVFYNRVILDLSTHSIGGLTENDFILAAKINAGSYR